MFSRIGRENVSVSLVILDHYVVRFTSWLNDGTSTIPSHCRLLLTYNIIHSHGTKNTSAKKVQNIHVLQQTIP